MLSLLTTRRWIGTTVLALLVAAACVRLGIWQLHRGEARSHYNATLHARAVGTPVPVDEVMAVGTRPGGDVRFRRVTAIGRYNTGATLLVRNRVQDGVVGYEVLVPLITTRGALLVDRGWVARAGNADEVTPVPAPPRGTVTVTGRLRDASSGDLVYTGEPTPSIARIDALAVGRRLGLPTYGTYIESTAERPAGDGALAPLPEPDDQNSGLNYAYFVQWEIFAVLALAGWFLLLRRDAAEDSSTADDSAADDSAADDSAVDGVSAGPVTAGGGPAATMAPTDPDTAGDTEREDHPWPA